MAASRRPSDPALRLVVMGVAGSGKSVVGEAVARRLGVAFADGDSFHSAANVAKMASGIALEDSDRWPWLDRIGQALADPDGPGVVACSALRRVYRERLIAAGAPILFVHLAGAPDLIGQRLADRPGHFMPPSLLGSQMATLEPPACDETALTVAIDRPVETIVDDIIEQLEGYGS